MEAVRSWVEDSAYGKSLGVRVGDVSEGKVRLELPYDDVNSNPGKALHGDFP